MLGDMAIVSSGITALCAWVMASVLVSLGPPQDATAEAAHTTPFDQLHRVAFMR
jgi:hypothetical protein